MLPKLSVRKPYTVLVAVILILVLGTISLTGMNTDLLPSLDLPYVVVVTTYPGAGPEKVEQTVTRPLEAALGTSGGLKTISSTSRDNSSMIFMEFEQGINMDSVLIELSGTLDQVEARLDDGVSAPMMLKISPDMMPIMVTSVDVEGMTLAELSAYTLDEIIPVFERLDGVASVEVSGLLEQEIFITPDADLIAAMEDQMKATLSASFDESETELKTAIAGMEANQAFLTPDMQAQLTEMKASLAALQQTREETLAQVNLADIVTADLISGILQAQNFGMPAGAVYEGNDPVVVKVGDSYTDLDELSGTLLLQMPPVGDIRLSDVATIEQTDNAAESFAKINGNNSVILTFQKQSISSTADVTDRINEAISGLEGQQDGLRILPLMDQGEYIHIIISGVLQNLLWGGLLAILVLLLFLRDIRPTLVIAISIPVSLLFALTLMYFTGVSLNIISLSGLALGIGMLVDNSIIVIENIYRLRHNGMSAGKAAVAGARQMSGAILASTLTTVCVFLPIVFTHGLSRQLFSDMGLTIAYSLLASLIVALTVVPAMSATALRRDTAKPHKLLERLTARYRKVLAFGLRRKSVVLVPVALLLILSLYGVTIMGTAFIPEMDSPQMTATLTLPRGTEQDDMHTASDQLTEQLLSIDAVEYVGVLSSGAGFMMGGGMGGDTGQSLSYYILLKDERSMTNLDVEDRILELTEDQPGEVSVSASNMDMSMLGGSGISVQLKGADLDDLREASGRLAALVQGVEGIIDVETDFDDSSEEMRITVDKDAAIANHLTVVQIYQAVAEALTTESQAIVLTDGTDSWPVLVSTAAEEPLTRDNLEDFELSVTGADGADTTIRLGDVAAVEAAPSLRAIQRDNQSRFVTVSAGVADGYNIGLVSRDLDQELENLDLPDGVQLQTEGENETINEALRDVVLMVGLAVLFIYLIMVAQFQSLLAPFIVLFTIPLAFTGGLLLLWILGMELSVIAALGFLVLAGVVVNNGIVFVTSVNQMRDEGMTRTEALLETGVTRIRPILMTAVTTILAMSTLALAVGQGAEMTQPMAVVAIGGLTYATLLTLLVVPIMYDIFHKRQLKPIDTGDDEA